MITLRPLMLKCSECSAQSVFPVEAYMNICGSYNNAADIIALIVIFKVLALHPWLMKEHSHVT